MLDLCFLSSAPPSSGTQGCVSNVHPQLQRRKVTSFRVQYLFYDERRYSALHLGLDKSFKAIIRSYHFDHCCFSPSLLHSPDHMSTSRYLYPVIFISHSGNFPISSSRNIKPRCMLMICLVPYPEESSSLVHRCPICRLPVPFADYLHESLGLKMNNSFLTLGNVF